MQAGAGIFSSTESWSFGVAMYFCEHIRPVMLDLQFNLDVT